MTTINYLAYGSNLYPPRLRARIAVLAERGMVELAGWALEFTKRGADGSGKCNLRAQPGATAFAAVYAIRAADKVTLDCIEGVGHGYLAHALELDGVGACYFYRAQNDAIDARLAPYDWYHALVLAGARHHRFPASYVAAIARVRSVRDADAARRRQHFSLLG